MNELMEDLHGNNTTPSDTVKSSSSPKSQLLSAQPEQSPATTTVTVTAEPTTQPPEAQQKDPRMRNTLHLSVSFTLIFTGAIGTTTIMGSEFGDVGAGCLSLMYSVFSIVALFFSPFFVQRVTARRCIPYSALTFLCLL
eukprot:PhF_6_TR29256/c0_g1_i1/m.42842